MDDRMKPPGDERREVFAILACKGRRGWRTPGGHRPEYLYVHTHPWPLPPGWSPRDPHSTFELHCHCGFAPRTSDEGWRTLIEVAGGKPGRILYIDGPLASKLACSVNSPGFSLG